MNEWFILCYPYIAKKHFSSYTYSNYITQKKCEKREEKKSEKEMEKLKKIKS